LGTDSENDPHVGPSGGAVVTLGWTRRQRDRSTARRYVLSARVDGSNDGFDGSTAALLGAPNAEPAGIR